MGATVTSLPAFTHTETCNLLAIGRRVMYHAKSDARSGFVTMFDVTDLAEVLAHYRDECDCGRTRLNAVMDELRRVGKAITTYEDGRTSTLTSAAYAALVSREHELRNLRDAIRAELDGAK